VFRQMVKIDNLDELELFQFQIFVLLVPHVELDTLIYLLHVGISNRLSNQLHIYCLYRDRNE